MIIGRIGWYSRLGAKTYFMFWWEHLCAAKILPIQVESSVGTFKRQQGWVKHSFLKGAWCTHWTLHQLFVCSTVLVFTGPFCFSMHWPLLFSFAELNWVNLARALLSQWTEEVVLIENIFITGHQHYSKISRPLEGTGFFSHLWYALLISAGQSGHPIFNPANPNAGVLYWFLFIFCISNGEVFIGRPLRSAN